MDQLFEFLLGIEELEFGVEVYKVVDGEVVLEFGVEVYKAVDGGTERHQSNEGKGSLAMMIFVMVMKGSLRPRRMVRTRISSKILRSRSPGQRSA